MWLDFLADDGGIGNGAVGLTVERRMYETVDDTRVENDNVKDIHAKWLYFHRHI